MKNVTEVLEDLQTLLSDIAFSGIRNIEPSSINDMKKLERKMKNLGMLNGAKYIYDFKNNVFEYVSNNKNEVIKERAIKTLCKLEFYLKNVIGNK